MQFETAEAPERRRVARSALIGGGVGLVAGWALTTNYDRNRNLQPERTTTSFLPLPTILPVESGDGRTLAVPGLATMGRF